MRLELFGRPALETEKGPVTLSPKQWAMVAFVYGEPNRRSSRDEVARHLWADGSGSASARRLAQLLYEVERRVGQQLLLKLGSTLRPNPDLVQTDVDEFFESVGSEELGPAAHLLTRGFLSGLPHIPTNTFDRWVDERVAIMRAQLRNRATERWARAEDEALWNQRTTDAAQALLFLEPGSEAALRRAMWAQAMSGASLEAMAALEGFVETNGLQSHDDLSEETSTLLGRVKALARHRKGSHVERPRPSRADPTLFGREQEVAALRPLVAGPISDGLTVVAVAGEGGLGKTRLVRECLEPAMLQGRLILQTVLAELEHDIPLNALIEAMNTQDVARALLALEDPWRSVILNLMPDFAEVVGAASALPYVQPASLQRRLLESVRLLMDEVVAKQPILMFIDDFHWADDSSLAALEYVRRRWSTGSLVLVVAYRPEHVAPESSVASFLRADSVNHVALGPIGEIAQKQLVREASGGEISDEVSEALRDLGGGNPLFLIELARQWSEGELQFPKRNIDPIRLPLSIQQLFERRLLGLGREATRVLEALSVLVKRVPMSVVRLVSGLSQTEVADGMEELDRQRLLRWNDDGAVLWHGLVRQAVLQATSEARKRWLHGQVADYLLGLQPPADGDEIALHLDRAERREEAFLLGLKAADQAEGVGALPEAIFFLGVCLRNADAKDDGTIRLRIADLSYRHGAYGDAMAAYSDALDRGAARSPSEALLASSRQLICRIESSSLSEGPPESEMRRAMHQAKEGGAWEAYALVLRAAIHQLARRGLRSESVRLVDSAAPCVERGDHRARCIALQLEFLRRIYGGVAGAGTRSSLEALGIAEQNALGDLVVQAFMVAITSTLLDGALETPDGIALQARALAASLTSGDIVSRFQIAINLGAFYLDIGELERAENHLARAEQLNRMGGTVREATLIHANLGELELERGRPEQARRHFTRALPEAHGSDWVGWAAMHAGLALCEIELGRLSAAATHLAVVDRELGSEPGLPVDFRMVAWSRARMAAARGRPAMGVELLQAAEAQAEGVHVPYWIRLRLRRLSMQVRTGTGFDPGLAAEAAETCGRLRLTRRQAQFVRFQGPRSP